MTKKLTKEQVFDALTSYPSVEFESSNEDDWKVVYYLHIKEDGTIVDSYWKADASFTDWIPCRSYVDTVDEFGEIDICDYERMDFEPFAEVVEDLTNQANKWLASIED